MTNVAAPEQMRGTAPYERVRECLVYPSLASNGRTKGIIHFLGGAFIGAAPDVIYRYELFAITFVSMLTRILAKYLEPFSRFVFIRFLGFACHLECCLRY